MIEMIPAPANDIVAFKIKGDVDKSSLEHVGKVIDDKLEHDDTLRMYAEMDGLGEIGIDAVLEDLRLSLRHGDRFRKAAIVSDKRWLELMSKAADKVWPNASVNHFGYGEQDDAMRWLMSD